MIRIRYFLGVLVPFFGLASVVAATAQAPTPTEEPALVGKPATTTTAQSLDRTFDADSVALTNLNAILRTETHDGTGVQVYASGSEALISALRVSVTNGILVIEQPEPQSIVGNTVYVERNVVITQDGGRSSVLIGGIPDHTKPEAKPIGLHLTLPREMPLSIRGFTGNARIGPMSAPVDLELLAGDAQLERLGSANLTVVGSAEIDVATADGALDVTIDGSGEIAVHDGSIPALTLETNGNATVSIGGRVGQAVLSLNGIADIRIAHIDARPTIDVNGISKIEIGNW